MCVKSAYEYFHEQIMIPFLTKIDSKCTNLYQGSLGEIKKHLPLETFKLNGIAF